MKPLIKGIPISDQSVGQCWAGKTFSNEEGVIVQGGKEFPQHLGILRVLHHPVHFGLELLAYQGSLPVFIQ
ncbi:MAG TPA: hypothetical protein PK014_12790 [Thermoanaerobaculia bacterium]|nr:hypothetical protein [Thermoanaerobaculia bacterium]HUM30992.1 hypothetical protein [Thermoanaerobaculia bacterium]HXK69275.1 hypothetical protein [Thermoanaerobaculia bacterium]